MPVRHAFPFAPAAVVLALASYGCDGPAVRTDFVRPSPISFAPLALARAISVQPVIIVPQALPVFACPAQPPFLAPFTLVFRAAGPSDLFLNQVQMQFVDRTGIRSATTTLARPALVDRFGSIVIPAFGTRSFPFSFAFGCVGGRTGTLTIMVVAADATGQESRASLDVAVH